MQQMAAGGSGPHPGGLPPGMNPLLNMGMGPGGLLSGMHPLANLQNQLQNFAFLQVSFCCSSLPWLLLAEMDVTRLDSKSCLHLHGVIVS